MAGVVERIPLSSRIIKLENREIIEWSKEPAMNLSADTVFEFLDTDGEGSPGSIGSSCNYYNQNESLIEEEVREDSSSLEDNKNFWENQSQILQATIRRTTSLETRIRQATKDALKEAELLLTTTKNMVCACRRSIISGSCRNCLMWEVCRRLRNVGFDCAVCTSKWKSSPDIPAGEYTFLEVIDVSNPKKEVRVVIEMNLRGEFEMTRAGEQYAGLIEKLPELFVGKEERLVSMIKILCSAAKKCMKEKKIHMGPWRRQKYMQSKWRLRSCERRTTSAPVVLPSNSQPPSNGYSDRLFIGPRASMLTVDFVEVMNQNGTSNCSDSTVHRTVVQVV